MPFNRPTLSELGARARADIDAGLPGADSRLRHSNLNVLAAMLAGQAHGLYAYIDAVAREVIPDTAGGLWLDRWAAIWSIARQPATVATGSASLTGTDGAFVAAGAVLLRADGVTYETTGDATIAAGVASVGVQARATGADGNAIDGATLSFQSPVSGIDPTASAAALLGGGDQEADASLRARFLARLQQPPQGGAAYDYVAWALDRAAHGVRSTRAWVVGHEMGLGLVTVRFMMDDDYADGIPQSGDVAVVAAHLDTVAPVGAQVIVAAPVPEPFNITVQVSPPTAPVTANIEAALAALIKAEAEFNLNLLGLAARPNYNGGDLALLAEVGAFEGKLLYVRDEKASGTAGGTFTSDAWQTRDLNTVLTNEITGASLASNQITLPAGTFYIEARAPARREVAFHKAKFRNTSDSTDVIIGTSESVQSNDSNQTDSLVSGRFTLAASKTLELQHRSTGTAATSGFGATSGLSVVEVCAEVKIWKVG